MSRAGNAGSYARSTGGGSGLVAAVDRNRFPVGGENSLFVSDLTAQFNGIAQKLDNEDPRRSSAISAFSSVIRNADIEKFPTEQEKLAEVKLSAAAHLLENPGAKKEMSMVFDAIENHDQARVITLSETLRRRDEMIEKEGQTAAKERVAGLEGLREEAFQKLEEYRSKETDSSRGKYGEKLYEHGPGSKLYDAMSGKSSDAIAKQLLAKRAERGGKDEGKEVDLMALIHECPPKLVVKIARVAAKMEEREKLEERAIEGSKTAKIRLGVRNLGARLKGFFKKVDIDTISSDLANLPQKSKSTSVESKQSDAPAEGMRAKLESKVSKVLSNVRATKVESQQRGLS